MNKNRLCVNRQGDSGAIYISEEFQADLGLGALYCVYNLAVPGLSWACCTVSTLCQDRCEYTALGQV